MPGKAYRHGAGVRFAVDYGLSYVTFQRVDVKVGRKVNRASALPLRWGAVVHLLRCS